MLPEYRRKIIISILAVIGIIIVIFAMYNLSKYVREQEKIDEEKVFDDAYPEKYLYYGFIIDEDNNYQLMGINSEFQETELGLRSFYPMDKMYYYNNHLVLYTDAINQINYNSTDDEFGFFELNPFYSNNTNVALARDYYIFYSDTTLEYCSVSECNRVTISNDLTSDKVLITEDKVFYVLEDGVYEFDLYTLTSNHVMIPDYLNNIELLAANNERLVFLNGEDYYAYRFKYDTVMNISEEIRKVDSEFSFVEMQDSQFIYMTKDSETNKNIVKSYLFGINEISVYTFNLEDELLTDSFVVNDHLLYGELSTEESIRYVLIDTDNWTVLSELENPFVVLIGV